MGQDLSTLFYRSETLLPPYGPEAAALRAQCVASNEQTGLTGYLHHEDGLFAQYVEGADAVVRTLLDKLLSDDRHRRMEILSREGSDHRRFTGWAMAASPSMGPIPELRAPRLDLDAVLNEFDMACIAVALQGIGAERHQA